MLHHLAVGTMSFNVVAWNFMIIFSTCLTSGESNELLTPNPRVCQASNWWRPRDSATAKPPTVWCPEKMFGASSWSPTESTRASPTESTHSIIKTQGFEPGRKDPTISSSPARRINFHYNWQWKREINTAIMFLKEVPPGHLWYAPNVKRDFSRQVSWEALLVLKPSRTSPRLSWDWAETLFGKNMWETS